MLCTAKRLKSYKLKCIDGEIGHAKDFYFDTRHWTVRYLSMETGGWLSGRKVMVSPYALDSIVHSEQYLSCTLTKEQIENGPSLNYDQLVSPQFETDYHGYFGWPLYWDGPHSWGKYPYVRCDHDQWSDYTDSKAWTPHLQNTRDVSGHQLHVTDGKSGHIDDFIINVKTWMIRYLIVSLRDWWSENKVLISPRWVDRISNGESKIFVDFSCESLKRSPKYTEESLLTLNCETELYLNYQSANEEMEKIVQRGAKTPNQSKLKQPIACASRSRRHFIDLQNLPSDMQTHCHGE